MGCGVHICNFSYSGGGSGRILVGDQSEKLDPIKIKLRAKGVRAWLKWLSLASERP
jgi:hypothetical protein